MGIRLEQHGRRDASDVGVRDHGGTALARRASDHPVRAGQVLDELQVEVVAQERPAASRRP